MRDEWAEFRATPLRLRVYLLIVVGAAIALALVPVSDARQRQPEWLVALLLILVSAMNIEIGRSLAGGLARTHQPHKALSAWAFTSTLLLAPYWLLVVVPVTYAHARWRGLRLPLWKWVGSAAFVILAGVAAGQVRHGLRAHEMNWMAGDGGGGFLVVVLAAAAFLAVESLLFAGSALLNRAEDEVWLRKTLTGWSFYGTEAAVLLIGGLLSAVWTGGPWFAILFVPIYALAQRAALHEPLREQAGTAVELAEKNDELELANQFKIDLIGMLGHEVGNPLTAIHGYSQLGAEALDAGDPRAAAEALTVVERNAEQMRHVLHDILTLVSSERGALTAFPQPCPLDHRLNAAAADQHPERRPAVECPPGLAAHVQPGHLDQMLANLLSNAEKYAGGATLLKARPNGDGTIELSVIDAGPGVPDAFREHLFERFSRDAATAQQVMGTGLGLFITRELARANGGDVVHRDARPAGSEFVVTLRSSA